MSVKINIVHYSVRYVDMDPTVIRFSHDGVILRCLLRNFDRWSSFGETGHAIIENTVECNLPTPELTVKLENGALTI